MANTPQFNIKTGSDSQLFFSREVTEEGNDKGKILDNIVETNICYEYPQLTRRTGHSIKGSTETIESQELRKGRTKSAPRKGNSSSEGSLDIELSPETYDDIFEAALRGDWESFASDANDAIINPDKIPCNTAISGKKSGQFVSNGKVEDGGYHAVTLLAKKTEDANALIFVDNPDNYTIEQLQCGKKDIKYSGLTQYGGIEGEDLYQEFQHLAVNTMDLSVSPGQIVTGSFGFMGANSPRLLQKSLKSEYKSVTVADQSALNAGVYYTRSGSSPDYIYTKVDKNATYDAGTTYYQSFDGMVKELAVSEDGADGRFKNTRNPAKIEKWLDQLDDKVASNTDQFTAREGFLFVNGRRVQYGSNLTMNLNNGLKQTFAIFESDAIATSPMSLDITGTLDAYLITNYSEFLYNYGIDDKDVELVFCFQDKEENPDYIYVIQIFKAKFETDISQGSDELTVSLPFTSFGERAMRIFRIRRKNVSTVLNNNDTDAVLKVILADKPASTPSTDDLLVTAKYDDGSLITLGTGSYSTGTMTYTFTKLTSGKKVIVNVKYKDIYYKKGYTIS